MQLNANMSQHYLLKCPECKTDIKIESRQAGQQTTCQSCNATVKIGTLREIRELPTIELAGKEKVKPRVSWNPLKRWLFVIGIVLLAAGSANAIYAFKKASDLDAARPPTEIDPQAAAAIDNMTLGEMAKTWQTISEADIAEWSESPHLISQRASNESKLLAYIFAGLAGIGLVMCLTALVLKN